MASFNQDSQGYGMQQVQGNGSLQAEYVPRSDFEAQMVQMLKEIQLEQRVLKYLAKRDAEEKRQRADDEDQQRNSFEDMVYFKLTDLQNQVNAITVSQEEKEKRTAFKVDVNQRLDQIALQVENRATMLENEIINTARCAQSKMVEIDNSVDGTGVIICKLVRAELTDTEESIVKRFGQRLEVHEEQNSRMFEKHSMKTAQILEKTVQEQVEELKIEFKVLNCHMQRVENRMEKEMGQLFYGMFKSQGLLDDSDSDESVYHQFYQDELPRYIDDSKEEKAEHLSLETRGDPPSHMPSIETKDEQFSCEDFIASRIDYTSNEAAHKKTMTMLGMREWDYMACAPIQEREHSVGVELPLDREDASLPPIILPNYSCEIACTPQVKACFGVLASSASRDESQEDSSWEDKNSSVDFEETKGQRKKRRQGATQVWLPRGILEVMKVFNLTEISLGETTCVPHKAKKRKRRRKASNPQSGIG